ncbi:hypothetical protein [Leptolyngbya sp. PCC 6406]|uniref:hypothetical protein n=1 Tax=Leptolyngbya sp. PCC 6406 TaxID=1173264 RepID=UPI0002ACACE4|nr:hypothetical protein [Leptolyngbya sp. PCC 6406]
METQELKAIIQQSIREAIGETIREAVREILREERLALCRALIPRVSEQEMAEIREQFGSPKDYEAEEFISATDWVKYGTDLE